MLEDDRRSHPMVFYLRLRFTGELERTLLERSIDVATARHPLLRSVVQGEGDEARFVTAAQQRPSVSWESDPNLDVAAESSPHDIHEEVGLRITVCQRDGKAILWLALHHVCCDGLGAMRFCEDLLIAYSNETRGERVPLPVLDEGQLADRDVFASSRVMQWLRWPFEMLCMIGSLEYFLHRPLPLRGRAGGPPAVQDELAEHALTTFASCRREIDEESSRRLLQAARDEGVTVNDLLLRDLMIASQDWLEGESSEAVRGHVRVMVPVNLRTCLHDKMPAANCVGMINVERRVYRWADPRRMLQVLAREMRVVKRLRLTVTMLRIIGAVRFFTGSLRRLQPVDRCLATCVLSNLGRAFHKSALQTESGRLQIGEVRLEQIEPLPPVRPWTGAGFGVVSYAGQMTISLLYDKQLLGPSGGEQLLDRFVDRLNVSAQCDRRTAGSSDTVPGAGAAGEPLLTPGVGDAGG